MTTIAPPVAADPATCRQLVELLQGQTVTRVSIEPWSVRLLFDDAELSIEGPWRLLDSSGSVMDQSRPLGDRDQFELWRLTGGVVEHVDCADDVLPGFCLWFSRDWRLEFLADNDGLDDWSLVMPNAKVFCNGPNLTIFS